ncbi:MAG: glycosyltransferase [bacterium]|nr:glycosyltransferase [bacterium]
MHKKLLIIIPDDLNALIEKGEIVENYYNPGNYFEEVHIMSLTKGNVKKLDKAQFMVGTAKLYVYPIGSPKFNNILGYPYFSTKSWGNNAIAIAKNIKPGLIRCYHCGLNTYLGQLIKQNLKVPLIVSLHGNPEADYGGRLDITASQKKHSKIMRKIELNSLKKADFILPVYKTIEPYLKKHGLLNYSVIYNFVSKNIPAKKDYNLSNTIKLLNIGRQNYKQKDPVNIIKALSLIDEDVKLYLVGKGDLNEKLVKATNEKNLNNKVVFCGWGENSTLMEKLCKYDIYVYHSFNFEISKTVIEALLAGLPVILNKHYPEPVPEFENAGYVYLVDDTPESYAEAIKKLIDDKDLRETFGRQGYNYALEHYNPLVMEQKVVEVYKKFVTRTNVEHPAPYLTTGRLTGKENSYNKAFEWIKNNTIPEKGIIVSSKQRIPYPEVTGYFIPTLYQWEEKEFAKKLAFGLISLQQTDGSFCAPDGKTPYTFDTGQVIRGLLASLNYIPESEINIRKACDWILTQVQPDGRLATPSTEMWGNIIDDRIHLYVLSPLIEAGKKFNEIKYIEAANSVLKYYKKRRDLLEFNTLSHFYAYIIEALCDLGEIELAKKGMLKMANLQQKDGGIPAYTEVKWVCSTGVAQFAVIGYKLGIQKPANRAMGYLEKVQNPDGGFYGSYGKGASYFPDEEISWAVKFFMDARMLRSWGK